MKTTLLSILFCLPLLLSAQEKEVFEGTIRTLWHYETPNSEPYSDILSKSNPYFSKLPKSKEYKSYEKQTESGIVGEYLKIEKRKGNKTITFIPCIGEISIHDGDSKTLIVAYPKYRVATKRSHVYEVKPIFKRLSQVKDTINPGRIALKNGIQSIKHGEDIYTSAEYEDIVISKCIGFPIDGVVVKISLNTLDIIEEGVNQTIFQLPSNYKIVDSQKLIKIMGGNAKWKPVSYQATDPIPNDFWNFNK